MLRTVMAQVERTLTGLRGIAGLEAVLVDAQARPLWSTSDRAALPQSAEPLPCLELAARHGRMANARFRGHSRCRQCTAAHCRLAAVVPVAGPEVSEPAAGALAMVWYREGEPGSEAADALLALATSLAGAVSAHLVAADEREKAHRLGLQFTTLAAHVAEPVLVLDAAGVVVHANPPAEMLFRRRLAGTDAAALFPGSNLHWDRPTTIPLPVPAGGGQETAQVVVSPLMGAEGEPEGALLLCRLPGRGQEEKRPPRRRRLYAFADIKGASPVIVQVKATAQRAALTDATVLIRGESGTGKEVFAQAVHGASARRDGPFVAVNCAAIPDTLLESELFGYDEGAFTGARKGGKPGKFELADRGTLFLDEIGDMPLLLQAKLLRVLQERVIERIGTGTPRPVDVRIIAATNQDLITLIHKGQFREDLYYRLNVIPLEIPPLRERKEDLPLLIDHLVKKYASLLGKEHCLLSADVRGALQAYHWPGNVRELENTIQYMVSLAQGPVVELGDLPPHLRTGVPEPVPAQAHSTHSARPAPSQPPVEVSEGPALPRERPAALAATAPSPAHQPRRRSGPPTDPAAVRELLQRYGTSTEGKRAVARALGISLATLYRWLRTLDLGREKE